MGRTWCWKIYESQHLPNKITQSCRDSFIPAPCVAHGMSITSILSQNVSRSVRGPPREGCQFMNPLSGAQTEAISVCIYNIYSYI